LYLIRNAGSREKIMNFEKDFEGPAERLRALLKRVTREHELFQTDVAERLGVSPQYLSDVKRGRRPLSERIAWRIEDTFGVNHLWLLHGQGEAGEVTPPPRRVAGARAERTALPVLPSLEWGDPRQSMKWRGLLMELGGPAAAASCRATDPYLLHLDYDAPKANLKENDLLLISQEDEPGDHEIVVLAQVERAEDGARSLLLARRDGETDFTALRPHARIKDDPQIVGLCLGVVWRSL
jgi:transcriptional regulator with XRE-family HTH domain